ncbi:FAD/NAD(P)-binding protein [Streptomyces griseorubiginosus]|uniref:Anaerobic sulfite reductase subunit B n=1 Tax=Streptomyces griseorubiginosus TaxID=67304 RepID=A0AAI8KRW5_9ACTN|nr:FAD/NAD(P)-binding protein [Streptomyces griseorubiginosus]AYC36069.1 Anaerobic sulfite reductase subunit B [Streptomyces griseorubiginosus]KUM81349.1 oxidoreductase [Streptomyces griseorubiginosus]
MTAVPVPYLVVDRRRETSDSVTLWLEPLAEALDDFVPGQFAMVHCFGRGEIPLSVSSVQATGGLAHTVRSVGAVSAGLCETRTGDVLGLRGPYGTGWDLAQARGRDLLVVAGGIGLAPLRPLILSALAEPEAYGRISVLIGARTPADLIVREEPKLWRTAYTGTTVDRPDTGWRGDVGVVTQLLERAPFEPADTTAFVCGPEPMIRATARELARLGMPPHRIQVSLERNMRCATGHCGHCQLGPLLVCRDGPVVGWDRAQPLLSVREL